MTLLHLYIIQNANDMQILANSFTEFANVNNSRKRVTDHYTMISKSSATCNRNGNISLLVDNTYRIPTKIWKLSVHNQLMQDTVVHCVYSKRPLFFAQT